MNFNEWIKSKGCMEPAVLDGQTKRFRIEGDDPGERSGWYIGTQVLGPNGKEYTTCTIGNWRSDERETYPGKNGRAWSEEEKKQYEIQWKKQKELSDKERKNTQSQAAIKAKEIWSGCKPAEGTHPYLIRKNIKPHGARVDGYNKLVIPLYQIDGEICGLQTITPDGTKKFTSGTKAMGAFFKITGSDSKTIAICEGFATAATIHEATGFDCFIALSCTNLGAIVNKVRGIYPSSQVIIFGDEDTATPGNPGRTHAENTGVTCLFPIGDIKERSIDWNDIHVGKGLDEVKKQIADFFNRPPTHDDSKAYDGVESGGINDEEAKTKKEIDKTYVQFPEKTKDGRLKGTIGNLNALLKGYEIIVRYNIISKEEEIIIPNQSFTVDNKANATIAVIISRCRSHGLPVANISEYLTNIADTNIYNPVVSWIKSVPWDGKNRLNDLYETVSSNTDLKNLLIKKWLISAVAGVFNPNGVSAHGVLVFRGNQYIGKTKWFKSLAPAELEVLKEGAVLRPDDKDSVFECVSKWMVELGELDATFRKSDIAQLKAFLTKDSDALRRPFARKESHYVRRTVFFASVNEEYFLNDPTGNRRFWTIDCDAINWQHNIDMQQLWAEVHELYKSGESWYLTPEENRWLNNSNESFQSMDPLEEKLRTDFAWDSDLSNWKWLSASEVCKKMNMDNPNSQQAKKVGSVLRKMIKEKPKSVHGITRFQVPPYTGGFIFKA